MYSGHYTASINRCKKHSIATTAKLQQNYEFEMIDTKNSSIADVVMHKLIT